MAERPILFMDEMVRAILDGRKTVTRRTGPTWAKVRPGDRLWVREAHALIQSKHCFWPDLPHQKHERYEDFHNGPGVLTEWCFYRTGFDRTHPRWRPSIHMPRWASRLTLEVVSVTEERAVLGGGLGQMAVLMSRVDDAEARREGFADRAAFLAAWRGMHPDYTGPVWRIEFRRLAVEHAQQGGDRG